MQTRETILPRSMLSISCQFKQTQTIQLSPRRYQQLLRMNSILRVISHHGKEIKTIKF